MKSAIDTIFFDIGNTLRIVVPDPEFQQQAREGLIRLTGTTDSPEDFFEKLEKNWDKYRKYAKTSLLDVSEMELWTQWLLPDYPTEIIAAAAGRLTRFWRDVDGRRIPRSDVKATLLELRRRGYTMGIIANTITETEIPDWMVEDGVAGCFKAVILSSKVRIRKPDPAIYTLAARAIGAKPENCAYIGDNPIRDVEGTRAAGFGMMIRIDEPDTIAKEPQSDDYKPDYTVQAISEMLDIFPPLR